jgi:hypothetical protein
MAVDESVTVKGSPVRSLQKFIDSELTPDQRAAALASLPADYASRLQRIILATETIPVHALNEFTAAAAKARNEPLEQFARRAGREGASDAVKGIYKFFVRVLMWTSLYNRGTLQVLEQSDRGARIRLADFPSEVAGCSRLTGWIERMAEMTGAKNVQVQQTHCAAKGGPYCEWTVSWQ